MVKNSEDAKNNSSTYQCAAWSNSATVLLYLHFNLENERDKGINN